MAQIENLRFEKLELPDNPNLANLDCIYEDSRGFMWFGSYSGLYLYDGNKLTHFKNSSNDPLSISDNKITRISEDSKGNLWVGTQNGLNYFDIKKRTFKRYNDKEKFGIGIENINAIKRDKDKRLWVCSYNGIYLFDSINQKFNLIAPQFYNLDIEPIELDDNGFYVLTRLGLMYKNFKTDTFKTIFISKIKSSQSDLRIGGLFKDDHNILWIGTNLGLFYINTLQKGITPIEYPLFRNESINLIFRKNKDELWIETGSGLYLLNTATSMFQKYIYNPLFPQGYPENKIYSAFHSSNNILWAQVRGKDFYTIDINKQRFQNTPIHIMDNITNVSCLSEMYEYASDTLLIRQKNGAGLLDLNSGKITPFKYKPDYNLEGWQGSVTCFLEENNHRLWIGNFGGLFLFDKITKRFTNLENQLRGFEIFRKKAIRRIHKDRKGYLWVGTWGNGVFKINFEKR